MNRSRRLRSVMLLLLAAFATGCATGRMYEGEERSRDEVAVVEGISGWDPLNPQEVDIETVDGVPVEGWFTRDVELLPGRHEIGVEAEVRYPNELVGTHDEAVVWLDAKPGGRYAIGARRDMTGLDIYAVDLESGEIVGWALPELSGDEAPAEVPGVRSGWSLVIGKRRERPPVEHYGWIPDGEPWGGWSEMIELVMLTQEDPVGSLSKSRESLEEKVDPLVMLADEPDLLAYATKRPDGEGWFVSVTRPGDGCLYLFTRQVREGELSQAEARAWAGRFERATLRPWTRPE